MEEVQTSKKGRIRVKREFEGAHRIGLDRIANRLYKGPAGDLSDYSSFTITISRPCRSSQARYDSLVSTAILSKIGLALNQPLSGLPSERYVLDRRLV